MKEFFSAVAVLALVLLMPAQPARIGPPTNTTPPRHIIISSIAMVTNKSCSITNMAQRDGRFVAQLDECGEASITDEGRTNIVNFLMSSGEVCRQRGHAFQGHVHTTLEYTTGKLGCRQCLGCGLHQTLFEDWK